METIPNVNNKVSIYILTLSFTYTVFYTPYTICITKYNIISNEDFIRNLKKYFLVTYSQWVDLEKND